MKLVHYGNRPLILVRDPQLDMEAATKNYVDTTVASHGSDSSLHLTPAQNQLLDNLVVTEIELNQLSGITGNVQALLDTKFDKAGGTITGDVTISAGNRLFISTVPGTDNEAVNKAYVDGLLNGLRWEEPVYAINLIADNLSGPPASPVEGDAYIVAGTGTGAWTGLDGHAVVYSGGTWVDLLGRAVQVGDRFGVALTSSTPAAGGLAGKEKKLVEVTGVGPYTYSEDVVETGSTTLTVAQNAPTFGVSYTLNTSGNWVPTNTSVNIVTGDALDLSGNILSVREGAGVTVDTNNNLSIDLYGTSGLFLTEDGSTSSTSAAAKLAIKSNDTNIVVDANGVSLSSSLYANIDDKVSKSTASTVSTTVTFDNTSSLLLNYTPTLDAQAVTKGYVDGEINTASTALQANIDTKVSKSGDSMTGPLTLSGDPTGSLQAATKNYVDTEAAKKLDLTGGTLTGALTLAADPTTNLEAATKQYVDAGDATKVSKAGDTMTGALTLSGDPTDALHAATKQYVDSSITTASNTLQTNIDTKVSKSGDTMTGALILAGDPTTNLEAATKQYVDGQDANLQSTLQAAIDQKLSLSGGVMTGYITLHADPTAPLHPATKQYVDNVAEGLSTKPSVRVATTGNLDATYANGTSGVNATLTGTANGALVIDGITVNAGDRVLVKDQTNAEENGAYVVVQTGDASSPFILRRVDSVDESDEIPGSFYFVTDGTINEGTGWVAVVNDPVTFAVGTDPIYINQFSGAGSINAGDGLVSVGNTINVVSANTGRIVVNADSIDLAPTGVTPGDYTKVTVDGFGRVTAGSNPNTLAGYGITDAQPLNANLTSLSSVSTSGILVRDSLNTIQTKQITVSGVGLSINNGSGAATGDIEITSNGTSTNQPNTLVARDANGDFSAGTITASLNGNASSATVLETGRDISITGDGTAPAVNFNGSSNVTLNFTLTDTGVTAGTYNKVTVDSKGRVTAATAETTIAGLGVTDVYTKAEVDAMINDLQTKIDDLMNLLGGRGL